MKDKKKSWFRRHKILTGILGFFAFLILLGAFSDTNTNSSYSGSKLVMVNSSLLVPQDSGIDRIWTIGSTNPISSNTTGFSDGTEKNINKVEDLEATHVTTKAYRFDSLDNAQFFYNQEKEKIDVRGVDEWKLGSNCFGIEKDNLLSGYTKGFCLRNNIVFYVESASSSYSYASDGKKFMNLMLKNV